MSTIINWPDYYMIRLHPKQTFWNWLQSQAPTNCASLLPTWWRKAHWMSLIPDMCNINWRNFLHIRANSLKWMVPEETCVSLEELQTSKMFWKVQTLTEVILRLRTIWYDARFINKCYKSECAERKYVKAILWPRNILPA